MLKELYDEAIVENQEKKMGRRKKKTQKVKRAPVKSVNDAGSSRSNGVREFSRVVEGQAKMIRR